MNVEDYYLHSIGPANEETMGRLKKIINNSLLSRKLQGTNAQSNFGNYLNEDDYISLLDLRVVKEYTGNKTNSSFYDKNSITLLIDKERILNDTSCRNYTEYDGKRYPLTLGEVQVKDCVPKEYIVGIAVPDNFDNLKLLLEIINSSDFEVVVCNYDGNVLYNNIKNRYGL